MDGGSAPEDPSAPAARFELIVLHCLQLKLIKLKNKFCVNKNRKKMIHMLSKNQELFPPFMKFPCFEFWTPPTVNFLAFKKCHEIISLIWCIHCNLQNNDQVIQLVRRFCHFLSFSRFFACCFGYAENTEQWIIFFNNILCEAFGGENCYLLLSSLAPL